MIPPVLFVVHDFLPQAVAGTELHVLRLAQALSRRRPVSIFHTLRDPGRQQYAVDHGTVEGLPVTRVVQNYPYRPLQDTLRDAALERIFRARLEQLRPAVVHFHHLAFLPLSLPAVARAAGAATVFTLHDYHLACPSGGQLVAHPDGGICDGPDPLRCGPCHHHHGIREGRLETLGLRLTRLPGMPPDLPFRVYHRLPARAKALLKRLNPPPGDPPLEAADAAAARWRQVQTLFAGIDRFITPSEDLAARFRRWGLPSSRIVHLPNPAPPGARATPLPPSPPLRLLFLGTLAPHKGLHRVIDAVNHLPPEQVRLEVCGDPDAFPVFTAPLLRRAGPAVRFTGPCPPERVPEKLEAAHALVLGSTWPENAPLTVLEALAAGRPVVAPRIGGIPEQLRDGEGGLLYDPRDPLGLPAALRRLTSEPALIERLAASIRPPVSAGAHALEVEAVYAAVTPGGRP